MDFSMKYKLNAKWCYELSTFFIAMTLRGTHGAVGSYFDCISGEKQTYSSKHNTGMEGGLTNKTYLN